MKIRNLKIRVVDKKKAYLSCIIALLLIFSLLLNFSSLGEKAFGNQIDNVVEHTVSRGETLWSIAEAYNSSNSDVRSMVYEIRNYNNIDGNEYILPGEVIYIPCN